jgi:regulator of ribonuclease activity A
MSIKISTPDISDKYPELKFLNIQFKNFGAKESFLGEILTATCPEDNSKVKEILNQPGDGRILIVDGQASFKVALMGDMIAEQAVKNNWAGVIINGCVRDVEILNSLDVGIFAIGVVPRKSEKLDRGSLSDDIRIGDSQISSGQWAYADLNGVIISDCELDLS